MKDFIFKIIVVSCLIYNIFRNISYFIPNRNLDIIKIFDIIFIIITVIAYYWVLVPAALRALDNKNKEDINEESKNR